ncbi:FRG domain-containing protein [Bradyrhizobium yuanmingense]|uniref:FRG domain-containing protein n=1 Tax=Bradyrhizobium yuanmingense TaxID=108015 RepID=A0A1C3UGM4_9BRAD|nr:FRG domain-containing protein [Bradyrhizobium yuanmingense]TWI32606.1 FRG domain-containing protein [Bradyrhizobium yuanmingense]SCB14565.1 FRG domain-containing protein [Bradyrhizobium yuanmingense]
MAENFNYISFGDWKCIEGNIDDITMGRGRMFEYTPSDTEKRLESLDSTAITFLEKLPTFLCSEIKASGDTVSMLIKYGRISNINLGRKEVSAAFETMIDFGEVEFEDIEAARTVFGADRFQLYRTHWAVREGDARDILKRLAEAKPDLAQSITAEDAYADDEEVQPPPRDKKILGKADSVEQFLKLLYSSPAKVGTETFFRGHSDARYELTPSLLRKWDNGDWQFMPSEDRLCKELLIAHHDEFHGDDYCFDRLVRMQHYGLPTRLLDISGNPLVALFFACSCRPDQLGIDGEVIVFRVASDDIKYYDSDTVSCLSNLSNLTYAQKNDIDLSLDPDAFNATDVAGKLLHHIKSEKGFFEGRIVPDDLGSIICVKAKRTNTRIKSQSGAFLLFGHEAALPDAGQNGIEISRVTIKNKAYILNQLDRININATTVYPSIDQTAVHLRDQHQSPKPARAASTAAPGVLPEV